MPLYTYIDEESSELVEKNVPIDKRDEQEGFQRVLTFRGLVYAPTAGGMR